MKKLSGPVSVVPTTLEFEDAYHMNSKYWSDDRHDNPELCTNNPLCLNGIHSELIPQTLKEMLVLDPFSPPAPRIPTFPCGLKNIGKTCYANVILQCLYHLLPFRKVTMSFDYGEGKTIINSFQTLFASMALSPNAVCDPSPIFAVLNLKTNELGDCFQFLTTVMVAFKDFLNLLGKASLFSSLTNVFTGIHKVCRCCLRCHRVFYSEDTFDRIDCQVRTNCRLEDTLAQEFQRINDTQADFLCPLCNQHCNSEQLKIIQHMPEILTIKVKRLTNGLHLQIPSTLDFRQFSSVDATVDTTEYVLSSVVYYHNHQGGGHYTCHVMSDNQCFSISDDSVNLIESPYVDTTVNPWHSQSSVPTSFSVYPIQSFNLARPLQEQNVKPISHIDQPLPVVESASYPSTLPSADSSSKTASPVAPSTTNLTSSKNIHYLEPKNVAALVEGVASVCSGQDMMDLSEGTDDDVIKQTNMAFLDPMSPPAQPPGKGDYYERMQASLEEGPAGVMKTSCSPSVLASKKQIRVQSKRGSRGGRRSSRVRRTNSICLKESGDQLLNTITLLRRKKKEGGGENISCEPVSVTRIRNDYNTFLEQSLKTMILLPSEKKLGRRSKNLPPPPPDSYLTESESMELEAILNENMKNMERIRHMLQFMKHLEEEGRVLCAATHSGIDVEMNEEDTSSQPGGCSETIPLLEGDELMTAQSVVFYIRKDLANSLATDAKIMGARYYSRIPTGVLTQIQKQDSSPCDSLIMELIDLRNSLQKRHSYLQSVALSPSLSRAVLLPSRDLQAYAQGADLIGGFIKSHSTLEHQLSHPSTSERDAAVIMAVKSLRRLTRLSEDHEENVCQHGRMDPLYCRSHYKYIPAELMEQIQKAVPSLSTHAVSPANAFCSTCITEYTTFLHHVQDLLPSLLAMSQRLLEITQRGVKPDIGLGFFVSKTFIKGFCGVLRNCQKLLSSCWTATHSQLHQCELQQLNPTKDLLCEHGRLRVDLRSDDSYQVGAELWNSLSRYFSCTRPLSNAEGPCEMCFGAQRASSSLSLGNAYSGMSTGIRVKQEPGLSAESIERLEKRRRVVQQTLSSDLVSGDGFLVSSRDNPMVPVFNPLVNSGGITMSSSVGTLSPGPCGTTSPYISYSTEIFPAGERLFTMIHEDVLDTDRYYIRGIDARQRCIRLLLDDAIQGVRKRNNCYSSYYFDQRMEILCGCYFLISAEWMQRWRQWLTQDSIDNSEARCDEIYRSLLFIEFPRMCDHQRVSIPVYMLHFFQGTVTMPWDDLCMNPEERVEIVNETEMAALAKYHRIHTPMTGFYISKSEDAILIDYLRLPCATCREEQEQKYVMYLRNCSVQRFLLSTAGKVFPDRIERKVIIKPREHHFIYTTHYSPQTPLSVLKNDIAEKIQKQPCEFYLAIRERRLDDTKTIMENNYNPEHIIYVVFDS